MDTPSKRFSAIHIALPFRGAGYIPDGTTDRQAAAFMYEGISAVPPAPPVPVTTKPGGIGHGRKSKYPKRVTVNGKVYTVRSVAEERRLLEEMASQTREHATILKALGDEVSAKRAEKKAVAVQARIDDVAVAYEQWLAKLRQDDEEILLLLTA
jgi:hypothetical protein